MTTTPTPKRRGRPPGSGVGRVERIELRARAEDSARLKLVRHLLKAKTDSDAIRKALEWTVASAGQWLTPEKRAEILAAE